MASGQLIWGATHHHVHSQQLCVETTGAVYLERSLHDGLLLHPELTKLFLWHRLLAIHKTVSAQDKIFFIKDIEVISRGDTLLKEDKSKKMVTTHNSHPHRDFCLSFGTS